MKLATLLVGTVYWTGFGLNLVLGKVVTKYDYLAFENFDLMRSVYDNETVLIQELERVKKVLEVRKARIETELAMFSLPEGGAGEVDLTNPINVYAKVKGLTILKMRMLENWAAENKVTQEVNAVLEAKTEDFPDMANLIAAQKGLFFLFKTYQVNYTETLKGRLTHTDDKTSSAMPAFDFPSREKLYSSDLASMSDLSFKENHFEATATLIKATFDAMPSDPVVRRPSPEFVTRMEEIRRKVVDLNNQYLMRRDTYVGKNFHTTKYLLNKKLGKAKKQRKIAPKVQDVDFTTEEGQEYFYSKACRGDSYAVVPPKDRPDGPQCHWLHHDNPFLKLGPFKLEVARKDPYIVIFHDILSEEEINFLIEYSKPRLTRERVVDSETSSEAAHEFKSGKKRRIVAKSVTCWIADIIYPDKLLRDLNTVDHLISSVVDHDLNNYEVIFPIMLKLSKKIEQATRMNATAKHASTDYQTTNYGLGGLVESHIDPHGYLEGAEIPFERMGLKETGDMMGTFMGWLDDCDAGGATSFLNLGNELNVWPKRGSAAFWFSLDTMGHRDKRTSHAGCPILKGSKWIVNKWLYSFDQFKNYPCGLNPGEYHKGFTGIY